MGGSGSPGLSPPGPATGFSISGPGGSVLFLHRIDYKGNRLLGVWEASGTHQSKVKPSNPLLLVWLLIMVIRASVIFLTTVYADAVKVKPFRNRFFAASGTYQSKVKPSNPLLLVWLLIMVIRASVIFLTTVYADAVKVKPFRNRFFAPACIAMRNAFEKLYLIT